MNMQGNNLPTNPQERRPNPMDQNPAAAMPNMMPQVMTSASMIPSGMHSAPAMTISSGNMSNQVGLYGKDLARVYNLWTAVDVAGAGIECVSDRKDSQMQHL